MNKQPLDLYTDYLLSSFGQTTATGFSQLTKGEISHIDPSWLWLYMAGPVENGFRIASSSLTSVTTYFCK